MSFTQLNTRLRLGLVLLASGAALGLTGPAAAQTGYPMAYREDPGSALSRHLKTLADSPRSLSALTGAAKAALELGDSQAALTFYARAEEIAPRDGRIKAGIGSAFLAMEQPDNALRFFEEARGLGAPEGEYAADRGLAYDLLGNPAQAQRDYLVAMRTHDTDELRRRLALSKAITGDRAGALSLIEPQLRRQDRAAWRVRAFVLALTGDAAGATEAVRAVMPQQAAAMQPFLTRLPGLALSQRAMAVHLGVFPGDGYGMAATPPTYAGAAPSPPYAAVTNAGRPSASAPALGSVSPYSAAQRPASTPAQSRPATSLPANQYARATAPAAPAQAPSSSSVQSRAPGRPASGPISLARDHARPQVPASNSQAPQPDVAGPPRNTGSAAQDRASGIYSRGAVAARRPATTPVLGSTAAGSAAGQRMAALNVRQAVPGRVVPTAPPAPVPQKPAFAAPAAVRTQAVQGPPSPAGASQIPPTVQAAPPPVTISPPTAPAAILSPAPIVSGAASAPASGPAPAPAPTTAVTQSSPAVPLGASTAPVAGSTAASLGVRPATPPAPVPAAAPAASSAPPAASTSPVPARAPIVSGSLASVAATIRSLDLDAAPSAASAAKPAEKVASQGKAPETRPASRPVALAKAEPEKARPAAKAEAAKAPSRHWVQIAGSADKSGLRGEFARLKAKAPKLLGDKSAWTAPLRFTNRLLVGPFKSEGEAQDFVNELAKAELTAFSWTSPSGQEVEKVSGK